jgi:hypothetical protein
MRRTLAISVGDKWHRCTVLDVIRGRNTECLVQCECGVYKIVHARHLIDGRVKSCGCWKDELVRERRYRHGHSVGRALGIRETPEYRAWCHAKERCGNPNVRNYHDYGGRGIRMCAEWQASFDAFIEHVGLKPSRQHSLDRIDNDGDYEPGNVRWATRSEQVRNRRSAQRVAMDRAA